MTTQPINYAARRASMANPRPDGHPAHQLPQCLLIVSGAPECLQRLLAALSAIEAEVTRIILLEEAASACRRRYDLVIVDVEPRHLANVLKTVRESAELADRPVLVEHCRLDAAPELAGVLPQYRAMPCGFADLLKLVHWYLLPVTSPQQSPGGSVGRLL